MMSEETGQLVEGILIGIMTFVMIGKLFGLWWFLRGPGADDGTDSDPR